MNAIHKQEATHTATPWKVGTVDKRKIFDSGVINGVRVGSIGVATASNAQNSAFIVRACNSHDDLVKALQIIASGHGCPAALAADAIAKAGAA